MKPLSEDAENILREIALTNQPGEGDTMPPTPQEAAIALDLPAFLAWMAERRDEMIAQARAEYNAAPGFGEAAYPALRWPSVPGEVWARADARAWRWYRERAGIGADDTDMAGARERSEPMDGLDLGGGW